MKANGAQRKVEKVPSGVMAQAFEKALAAAGQRVELSEFRHGRRFMLLRREAGQARTTLGIDTLEGRKFYGHERTWKRAPNDAFFRNLAKRVLA